MVTHNLSVESSELGGDDLEEILEHVLLFYGLEKKVQVRVPGA